MLIQIHRQFFSAALSSATQHAIPPDPCGKLGTECLNTSFLLPTLLCAENSVKLIFFLSFFRNVFCVFEWSVLTLASRCLLCCIRDYSVKQIFLHKTIHSVHISSSPTFKQHIQCKINIYNNMTTRQVVSYGI